MKKTPKILMIKKLPLTIGVLLVIILSPLTIQSAAEAHLNTELEIALQWNNTRIAESALNKKANINLSFQDGSSPLHRAAMHNDIYMVNMLIARKANVNAQDANNATPLMNAIKVGSCNVIKDLILAGADLYVQDTEGNFAINYIKSPRALRFFLAAIEDKAIIRKEQQLRDAIELEKQEILAAMDAVQEQKEAAIKAIQKLLR